MLCDAYPSEGMKMHLWLRAEHSYWQNSKAFYLPQPVSHSNDKTTLLTTTYQWQRHFTVFLFYGFMLHVHTEVPERRLSLPRCSFKAVWFGASQINMWVKVSKHCGEDDKPWEVNNRKAQIVCQDNIKPFCWCFWCFVHFLPIYIYIHPEVTSFSRA